MFYFNGTAADTTRDSFAWRPAPPEHPVYGAGDGYLEGNHSLGAAVPFGAAPSVWGSWGIWPGVPVRPPPGFAPPVTAPVPPPLETRTYDPFRSLASIWAPAPNEWRAAPGSPASEDQRENLD
uniref:Uncharacterized protein n=1 Tax=Pararge aegeria TaxID=116150 RepID=S4PFP3_9NEOP